MLILLLFVTDKYDKTPFEKIVVNQLKTLLENILKIRIQGIGQSVENKTDVILNWFGNFPKNIQYSENRFW